MTYREEKVRFARHQQPFGLDLTQRHFQITITNNFLILRPETIIAVRMDIQARDVTKVPSFKQSEKVVGVPGSKITLFPLFAQEILDVVILPAEEIHFLPVELQPYSSMSVRDTAVRNVTNRLTVSPGTECTAESSDTLDSLSRVITTVEVRRAAENSLQTCNHADVEFNALRNVTLVGINLRFAVVTSTSCTAEWNKPGIGGLADQHKRV